MGLTTTDERVPHAAPRELHRQRCGRDAAEDLLRLCRERREARNGDVEAPATVPRRRREAGRRTTASQRAASTIGLRTAPTPSISTSTTSPGCDHCRACRRAGQDHVTRLERDEAREVGDQELEGEQERVGRVVLTDLAVDAGQQPERAPGEIAVLDRRADRREAVLALGEDVRAAIGPAEVGDADVVRGCNTSRYGRRPPRA